MKDGKSLAGADAHLALLQCQEELQLATDKVMPPEDLLAAALQPESGFTAVFKILIAGGSKFRQESRCSISDRPSPEFELSGMIPEEGNPSRVTARSNLQ